MLKYKVIALILFAVAFTVISAYSQDKAENQQPKSIVGTIAQVDYAGDILVVNTDGGQMSFSVSNDTKITRGAEQLGLEDLEEADPVAVQYYNYSPGNFVALSIIDKNMANE